MTVQTEVLSSITESYRKHVPWYRGDSIAARRDWYQMSVGGGELNGFPEYMPWYLDKEHQELEARCHQARAEQNHTLTRIG